MSKTKPLKWMILFAIFVAISGYGIHPVTTFDTFFGLKIGELIIKTGKVPLTEPFSWAAQGRAIVPYEWLAQVWVSLLHQWGGFAALEVYVGVMLGGFFLMLFGTLRAMKRDFVSSLLLAIWGATATYDFFVARPQIISFLALIIFLYLIFEYILYEKNKLVLTVMLMYVWANSHASFVMGLGLLGEYALIGFWYWSKQDEPVKGKRIMKTLLLWLIINVGVTLLPPLGWRLYEFLANFSGDLKFMTQFISEWAPLSSNKTYEIFYSFVVCTTFLLCAYFVFKNKKYTRFILSLPMVGIMLLSFQALRHVPLGIISAIIVVGFNVPNFYWEKKSKWFLVIISSLILFTSVWMAIYKRQPVFETIWKIPSKSAQTDMDNLVKMDLHGKMFNEFAVGGYLLYYLYPKYQIFFDGRADIYHCCEMRDYWPIVAEKNQSPEEFKKIVQHFLDKYDFSYLIVPTYSYNPMDAKSGLMVDVLVNDPKWRLVYFSDLLRVVVRDDGKNPQWWKNGFVVATPYGLKQYPKGKEAQAKEEYERMSAMAESGFSRNALGNLELAEQNLSQARVDFEMATNFSPTLGKAYVGLAKVDFLEKKINLAKESLRVGIKVAPYEGEAYILLAKEYIAEGNVQEARSILEKGLKQNIDFVSLREMVSLLGSLGQSDD